MSQHIETVLKDNVAKINKIYAFATEDLLEIPFYYKTKHEIEDSLQAISGELDEMDQLRIKKIVPVWRNEYRSSGFMQGSKAVIDIDPLREFIIQLQVKYSGSGTLPTPTSEILIPAGKSFEGKQRLRSILNEAKSSILIRDNYLKPEILDVLSEYVVDGPTLDIKILVGENNRLPALQAHFKAFEAQFPNKVSVRFVPKDKQDHPRYILLDETQLFNPDHSLDQWGISSVNIHKVKAFQDIKSALEKEWQIATPI